jgi:hypothetical protein
MERNVARRAYNEEREEKGGIQYKSLISSVMSALV